ncbi:MAG TPA: (d)CMP kinase [Chitinophagaceae bacterium]|nr:(d)CMP kinase [Chitinophagaceae bacterium]
MSMKRIIITIDGYSSCGKSTLARELAREIDYLYIDSGAMYRAITLYFIENNITWDQEGAVREALKHIGLEYLAADHGQFEINLNGKNVEGKIRELPVADKVSEVAAIRPVREFAVALQQKIGAGGGIVMDGRDIGTTVFPRAQLKLFMMADMEVRIQRRFREMVEKNPRITLEEVRQNIERRDFVDSHRETSPLRRAPDAIILDNSRMSPAEQLDFALILVNPLIRK